MRIERVYVADDGTKFTSEHECQTYELNQRLGQYLCLEDYIIFYNIMGNPIPYTALSNYSIYYAKVMQIPDWNDCPERAAWEELVPSELDDKVESWGPGWYVSDGDDNWESWENYSNEYSNRCATINKIVCEGK